MNPADMKKIVMSSVTGLGKLGGNDKFDPKSEKIKRMNSVLASSACPESPGGIAFHNNQDNNEDVLVNENSYSSDIYQNGQLDLGV